MKKGRGLARAVPPLSPQALEALPTGALLARLKRLRWCEESRSTSDLSNPEIASAGDLILFKEDPAWRDAYADLRAVLGRREHLPDKPRGAVARTGVSAQLAGGLGRGGRAA